VKSWLVYTLIRLGLFFTIFALLYAVLNFEAWVAAIIAAIAGLCLAYLFFRPQRDRAIEAATSKTVASSDELSEDR
jgi:membrane associated rhomboid family serine protease